MRQRTKKWLGWRSNKITATSVGTILGYNPFQNKHELLKEKVGLFHNFITNTTNEAMQHGIDTEPFAFRLARKMITSQNKDDRLRGNYVCHADQQSWLGGSPDGVVLDKHAKPKQLLEIKCPAKIKNVKAITESPTYLWQVRTCMYCAGLDETIFFVYHKNQMHLEIVREAHQQVESQLPRLQDFYGILKELIQDEARAKELFYADNPVLNSFNNETQEHLEPIFDKFSALIKQKEEIEGEHGLNDISLEIEAVRKEIKSWMFANNVRQINSSGCKAQIQTRKGSVDYVSFLKDLEISPGDSERYRKPEINFLRILPA